MDPTKAYLATCPAETQIFTDWWAAETNATSLETGVPDYPDYWSQSETELCSYFRRATAYVETEASQKAVRTGSGLVPDCPGWSQRGQATTFIYIYVNFVFASFASDSDHIYICVQHKH